MALSSKDFNEILDSRHAPAIVSRENGVSVEPSSIDLHLGKKFGSFKRQKTPVKVWDESTYPEFREESADDEFLGHIQGGNPDGEIHIKPGEFLLAHTQDHVHLPSDCVGFLHGRSSVGRLGLFVHNAGLVDAGFGPASLTLELYNASKNTIALRPGMRICQMTVHSHDSPPDVSYSAQNGNKYQNQRGPTPSRLYEDF